MRSACCVYNRLVLERRMVTLIYLDSIATYIVHIVNCGVLDKINYEFFLGRSEL